MLKYLALGLVVVSCGSSPSPDPRCVSACPETMLTDPTIGDVCSEQSRTQCLDDCSARIAGVKTVCASCLLENASFAPPDLGENVSCSGGTGTASTCTISGWKGSCTFAEGDQAAALACEKQVSPRRAVACTASFRPVTECSSVCN